MTTLSRALPLMLVGAMMVAGCQKTPEPKTSATTTEAPVAPVSQSSSTSVALPKDKMPPSDTAIAPQTPSTTASSGASGTPSQVRPEQLTKEQEQAALPMSGQVNNHSTPNTTPPDKKE